MRKWVYAATTALASIMLLHPAVSQAGSVSGRLSGIVEFYDDAKGAAANPMYLYGYANARDLGDNKGLNFRCYGRLARDGSEYADEGSELYYALFEKKNLLAGLDVKFGRQFAVTTAGATTLDGLDLIYDLSSTVETRIFAGKSVAFVDGATTGAVVGGEVRLGRSSEVRLPVSGAVSYFMEKDGSDLARELFGLEATYEIADFLELTGEYQQDLLKNQVSHFFLEANYIGDRKIGARLSYLYDVPVFDATSIYSVFAVDNYREVLGEVYYKFSPGVRAIARVKEEIYKTDSNATVFEAGVEKFIVDEWSGYVFGTLRNDPDGQSLKGLKAALTYKWCKYFQPGVGVHYDVLERRVEDSDTTTSRRMWIQAYSEITPQFSLEGKIESSSSALYDTYRYGRIQATYRF